MDLGLRGNRAVITGGSKGIGLGIADAFAREGADVLICARNPDKLDSAHRALAEHGGQVDTPACDVATAQRRAALIGQAADLGGAEILVSNAGTGSNGTVMDTPDDKWQACWDLPVMAAVRPARGMAPRMVAKSGGAMLMNASICAVRPLWYEPIYKATKAALMMFGKCLSTERIPQNIRVNVVNPGLIRTPDRENTAHELAGENWEGYLQQVADDNADIKRFGSLQELADFCVLPCSPRASYSVGSVYHVDGGMLKGL